MLVLLVALGGCTPTCDSVCDKLVLQCQDLGTERSSTSECEVQCLAQRDLYAHWSDGQKREAFDEQLRCLSGSTCDEIADGVCYDEDVWSF
jgi:hypothetical protein